MDSESTRSEPGGRSAVRPAVIALVVIAAVFAMRAASEVVVPTLLAVFLTIVAETPVAWLNRKGLPRAFAILLVVLGMALLLAVVGLLVGSSVRDLTRSAATYEEQIRERAGSLLAGAEGSPLEGQLSDLLEKVSPEKALGLAASLLGGVGGAFGDVLLILMLMLFLLFELPGLETRMAALGSRRTWRSFERSVRGYLVIKTLVSLATGVLVGVLVAWLGLDFAALWGLLAFLFNYVPTIGSILAAVPAVLMALVQGGLGLALPVTAVYLAVNVVIGNVLEPRIAGKGLGLSTFVVLFSLIFWKWVLGPVGMLLSVPLTTAVKLGLESGESTRRFAALLGESSPEA